MNAFLDKYHLSLRVIIFALASILLAYIMVPRQANFGEYAYTWDNLKLLKFLDIRFFLILGPFLCLFYFWPLRQIALGEIMGSFILAPLFFSLCTIVFATGFLGSNHPSYNLDMLLFSPISLILWAAAFCLFIESSIKDYKKDKAVQKYSLPVLIGINKARIAYICAFLIVSFFIFK